MGSAIPGGFSFHRNPKLLAPSIGFFLYIVTLLSTFPNERKLLSRNHLASSRSGAVDEGPSCEEFQSDRVLMC